MASVSKRRSFIFIQTYRDAVGVFLTDPLGLSLALLEGVLVLELGSHGDGVRAV
jgi:hypothetical protein